MRAVIDLEGLDALIRALGAEGYTVVGPTVRDGAIVLDEIDTAEALPVGWTDEQDGGTYRIRRRDDDARFGFAAGPDSWKRVLHPPRALQWGARRDPEGGFQVETPVDVAPRYALFGVRACDLAAIAAQDRVLVGGAYVDRVYASRRRGNFVVAVNCGSPAATCFCVSMGTGPKAERGYDLALTELIDGARHEFLVEAASEPGTAILTGLAHRAADAGDEAAAEDVVARARQAMVRAIHDPEGVPALLLANLDHPRWDEVARRCLSCGNCTMVCPTCFCTRAEEVTPVASDRAEQWRSWDSCFTLDFSYLHGGSVRSTTRSRYRQWLTHKLATWWDQFGESGCVGCGRCVTWCPVGIDLTEEVAAIAADRKG